VGDRSVWANLWLGAWEEKLKKPIQPPPTQKGERCGDAKGPGGAKESENPHKREKKTRAREKLTSISETYDS